MGSGSSRKDCLRKRWKSGWEDWMREADRVLEDEELIGLVYEALGRRCAQSRVRGRRGTPAEVVLRLMILKHVRDWSFEALERDVRANLVYRRFTRIGGEKVPDEKTLARVMRALRPEVVEEINRRLVQMAQQQRVVKGRKMRLDTTVVETNIHYPTDSSLLGDGGAGANPDDEKNRGGGGRVEAASSESDAECEEEGDGHRAGESAEGAGGRRAAT